MDGLGLVKTADIKRELERRGVDTSSVTPAKKTWTVGFEKNLYQYIDDIEADTAEQAISVARSRLNESDWSDFGNGVELESCTEV